MREKILEYRKKHKLTQLEFCKLSGVGLDLLSRIEKGWIEKPKRLKQLGLLEEILSKDNPREEKENEV